MKQEKMHKIFEEVWAEDEHVFLRYAIPKYDEYYIGRAGLISEVERGRFTTKTKTDYQSLTMIEAPIILDYLYNDMVSVLSGYNEIKDSYPELDMDSCYLTAMNKLIIDVRQSYSNLKVNLLSKTEKEAQPSEELLKQLEALKTAEESKIQDLEEVISRKWLDNANPITKTLISIGYTPIWVKYGIRTRTITLVKQAGNSDAYKITSVTEFIPRDERKNCSYLSMNEIVLTANAANALIKKDQKESEKEKK